MKRREPITNCARHDASLPSPFTKVLQPNLTPNRRSTTQRTRTDYVGYAGLASAVANAGGLGLVTALTQPTPEALSQELDKAKALWDPSKGGQLGVNLTILPMFAEVNYDAYKDVIVSSGLTAVETAGRPPGEFVKAFQDAGMSGEECVLCSLEATAALRSKVFKGGVETRAAPPFL